MGCKRRFKAVVINGVFKGVVQVSIYFQVDSAGTI
jgi:hypothetical protein